MAPRTLRIFLSSPGDVAAERNATDAIITEVQRSHAWRGKFTLEVVRWDDPHAAVPMDAHMSPQDAISAGMAKPSECDIAVVILWSRMGTPLHEPRKADGTQYLSGTEWEYEDAIADRNRRVLLFRREEKPRIEIDDKELDKKREQYALVGQFFERFEREDGTLAGSVIPYSSESAFAGIFRQALEGVLRAFDEGPTKVRGKKRQPAADSSAPPATYLRWLKEECGSIELLGLRLKQGQHVRINHVYVPLTTLHEQRFDWIIDESTGDKKPHLWPDPRKLPVLLELLDSSSLYISGPPGCGKSTFCRWLGWILSEGNLPEQDIAGDHVREQFPESLRGKLPLFVPLRDFHHVLPKARDLSGVRFAQSLERWLDRSNPGGLTAAALRAVLDSGKAMLMFDGADEVPLEKRAALVGGLRRAMAEWRAAGNRILLTSRPYGLSDADTRHLALPHAPIDGLLPELQRLLVRRWFHILADNSETAERTARGLLDDLRSRSWLTPLAENPLLLTAMCIVYGEGRRLPQDKYELYDRIVDTVLHSRFDAKEVPLIRNRLAVVAHGMHTGLALNEARETPEAQTTEKEIDRILESYRTGDPYFAEEGFRQVTESRERLLSDSGLLLPLNDRRASFYHLSIQEFLAAQRMADLNRDGLLDVFVSRGMRPEWRNTLTFLYGSQLANNTAPRRAAELLIDLMNRSAETGNATLATLAADCVEILQGRGVTLRDESFETLRQACAHQMRTAGQATERCVFGDVLGRIGDLRFRRDCWYLPDDPALGFIEIAAGAFQAGRVDQDGGEFQGDPPPPLAGRLVTLPRFFIGKWPVTVAQFRAFAEDRESNQGFQPGDPDCLLDLPNHPVVRVSRLEAESYCRWLTKKLRDGLLTPEPLRALLKSAQDAVWNVALPHELEWEKAARGIDGRIYPWGDSSDSERANYKETRIGATSAVGCFPKGASPYGAEDMSGNAWEWTSTFPSVSPDEAEHLESIQTVVRGGYFDNESEVITVYRRPSPGLQRTLDGHHNTSGTARWLSIGFRVVISAYRPAPRRPRIRPRSVKSKHK